jgi:hypothetical protein
MLHDLRTAVRSILKDRWLAGAAVFALALGIGVNATVFTLVNAVLIRGLPFHDSANLYVLGIQRLNRSGPVRAGARAGPRGTVPLRGLSPFAASCRWGWGCVER